MNDDFLHQLRVQPSASFAAKLKVRLDTQSAIATAKRRALKWYVLCGLLLGTTAVALIVPSVRTAVVALFQWRSEVTRVSELAPRSGDNPRLADRVNQRTVTELAALGANTRPSPTVGSERTSATAIQGGAPDGRAASIPSQNSAATLAPDSRRVVHIAVAPTAKKAADKIIAAFESAYGYEARRNANALPACSWPMPDVFVTLGRMSAYEDSSCRKAGVTLITTPIAYDAYVAIVNRENTWAQSLTIDDLRALAQPRTFPNPLATWDQIRAEWPSLPINVIGLASTYGKDGETFVPVRSATPLPFVIGNEDADIVKMIDASYGGLGFMRFTAYSKQLEDAHGALPVKALAVVSASGETVMPSKESVQSGLYDTLSQPLLLHVNGWSLRRVEVLDFGTHTIEAMPQQLGELGYSGIDKLTKDSAARKLRALSSQPR